MATSVKKYVNTYQQKTGKPVKKYENTYQQKIGKPVTKNRQFREKTANR